MQPLTPSDPTRVGPFRLLGRLGAGGMGLIYAGTDSTGRRAAVKVIQPQLTHDPAFRSRFAREAILLGRVDGKCTARVLAADVDADPAYLALEYVDGATLAAHVADRGPLSGDLLLGLAVGLAEALSAIHAAGVVHRDLKPANVILSADGPKVIDFGVAYLADATNLTTSGLVLGSPGWMAPEQYSSDETSPASDVFAWASTVFFAATGRPPFGAGGIEVVAYRILNQDVALPELDEPLASTLAWAFAKDPTARPTVAQLLERLTGHEATDATQEATKLLARTWDVPVDVDETWLLAPPAATTAPTTTVTAVTTPVQHTVIAQGGRRRRRAISATVAGVVLAAVGVGGAYALAQSNSDQPITTNALTSSPSPSLSASPTPTAAAQATTEPTPTATPEPPKPKPPFFRTNPVCAGKSCELLQAVDGVRSARGRLRVEVIGLPLPSDSYQDPTLRPNYISLYDESGTLIYTTPKAIVGAFEAASADYPDGGVATDKAGRVFVPFAVGAHASELIVLDANNARIQDFGSVPAEADGAGRFSASSPGSHALDIDGDGVNEIVLYENDYTPSYADGTTYERYYAYDSYDWKLVGCTALGEDVSPDEGPQLAPGAPGCEQG